MSIVVNEVVKSYGQQQALKGVSFSISSGEIVGFLGPNGAGKSTMMKIITGLLPQSSGEVRVCDINSSDYNESFRRKIGYLPEHNPLYLDMYVREYLLMVAQLYSLSDRRDRVSDMVKMIGLSAEQNKKIGALSKGYRQRVGLAQSLIHDPEVLILDEPTTGLDPNQILEIRELIKTVGQHKTVMLSTHIMQEVEAICERVMILNRGELVLDHPSTDLSLLRASNDLVTVELEFSAPADIASLQGIDGVVKVEQSDVATYQVQAKGDVRRQLFDYAVQNKLYILAMNRSEHNLEHLFHDLTRES
ncbi:MULTISPECIES: ATP-binding cassette domain-containing protein [unclassified Carboxylicivirga]|uniref:ATP-binding cassette domain-containing protein n=1 Tax=Carboxylicivirga TaxID=1628153 RepID=UPI003D34D39C